MQIFEGLTKFEDGTTIVPDLAVSWTNPNSSTWVFKLRPNVMFHTGRTMTASDVKASIEAVQSSAWGQEFASTIKSIEVINPLTVEIDTNGPDPLMLNELTRLYVFDTTSGKTDDAINGTGPYNLASTTPNDIKLTAFNNYWGGHVYTKEVDFIGYQSGSDIPTSLLTSKKLQVISVPLDPAFAATLKSDGYVISVSPTYAVGQLVFDTRAAGTPLANPAVRRALAEAVNKPEIISVSGNTGSPPANQIVAQGIPGYDPSIPTVAFSVSKAKTALAAAGYPNGFSFTFAYYAETTTTALATEFQKEMAAIGVTVVLEPTTDENGYANTVENGGADMYYDVLSSDYVDGSDILSFFVDSPYYSNPAMDALNTQASKTLDATKRVQLLQQMNALVSSDQANIPLFQRQSQVLAVAPHIVIMHDTDGVVQVDSYFYHDYQN
jgi:peptide/nickel transport system substrate-binding protein